jgi:carboxyl-terminal processing protease
MNRGAIYNGPMIVLVNGFSASASEIFSAAVQDYNRALIVGCRTYGKATGQNLFPLRPNAETREVTGYAKLTVSKYYRVTGLTHQRQGVMPQIVLPHILEGIFDREADERNAILADSTTKKSYYKPLPPLPVDTLSIWSAQRIKQDPEFAQIAKTNQMLREFFGQHVRQIPLNWDDFVAHNQTRKNLLLQLDEPYTAISDFYQVQNTEYDRQVLEIDPYLNEINGYSKETISKDPYIEEAYFILNDLINKKP